MYKLAIFDMDGTILNTIDDLADCCNYICSKYGFPLHTVDQIKSFVGNGIPRLMRRALPSDIDDELFDKLLSEYIEYYGQHCNEKTAPYEGIVECIKNIRRAGVKVAVNTNKVQDAAEELCNIYFPDMFDCIMGSRPGIPPKPDPKGLYEILKEMNISKQEACVPGAACFIGDSDVDLQTGLNSGFDFIGVDWGFRGKDFLIRNGAEVVVMNAEELQQKIL
ncbi:MAG: HAD family hydrolase [Treponema sp.]|nr:HAD family hydrolase [Treponema sp.]